MTLLLKHSFWLCRLEKATSILDLRMECQELEKVSVINRFAKFHVRPAGVSGTASSPGTTTPKLCPQRYIVALPMPENVPEGAQCLSLWLSIDWSPSQLNWILFSSMYLAEQSVSSFLSIYMLASEKEEDWKMEHRVNSAPSDWGLFIFEQGQLLSFLRKYILFLVYFHGIPRRIGSTQSNILK